MCVRECDCRCPKITKVSDYYKQAWNMLDTANGNGAGANSIGSKVNLINKNYGSVESTKWDGTAWVLAPAALSGTCGTGACNNALGESIRDTMWLSMCSQAWSPTQPASQVTASMQPILLWTLISLHQSTGIETPCVSLETPTLAQQHQ